MTPELQFNWIDDEMCEVTYDGRDIITLTHDEYGWAGMESMKKALEEFAYALDISVRVIGEEGI